MNAALVTVVQLGPEQAAALLSLFFAGSVSIGDTRFRRAHQTMVACQREERKHPANQIMPYRMKAKKITSPAALISFTALI